MNLILLALVMACSNLGLTVLQWNANGIRSRTAEFRNYLSGNRNRPDVICLQETNLKSGQEWRLLGYNVVRCDSNSAKGGVAVYINSEISYTVLKTVDSICNVGISIRSNGTDLNIINIYNPPGSTIDKNAYISLFSLPNVLIFGDFNAWSPLWGSRVGNKAGSVFEEIFDYCDLAVLNTGETTYTHYNGNESAIDLSLASKNLALRCNWGVIANPLGSDHRPIRVTIDKTIDREELSRERFNTRKADWGKFELHCADKLTINCLDSNLSTFYDNITTAIISSATASIPISKASHRLKSVPYWNKECSSVVKARNRAHKVLKRCNSHSNIIKFKQSKAKAKYTIKLAQRQYWRNYCEDLNRDTKLSSVWRMAKRMTGSYSQSSMPNLTHNNVNYTTSLDKANIIAQTLAHTCSDDNFTDKFKCHKSRQESDWDSQSVEQSAVNGDDTEVLNAPFTKSELKAAIRQSRADSSPGDDCITYGMIKHMPSSSRKILLLFYNRLWSEGRMMEQWKQSVVIPVVKQGKDASNPLSYRPIALTSVLCKINERLISNRLDWYLTRYSILNPVQSGFRSRRSTIDHLTRLADQIYKSNGVGHYTVATFIDFSNAFDMLWRRGLLQKLSKLGIRGNMYEWINGFLSDRRVRVRVGNCLSDEYSLENGTPQGSVLSPLLFLIMINDIPSGGDHNSHGSLFADDSAVWRSGSNLSYLLKKQQETLNTIVTWCDTWGFKLNEAKTVSIIFSRKNKLTSSTKLTIYGKQLKFVESTKFLGLIFDSRLSWSQHIQHVLDKSKCKVNLLRSLSGQTWGADKVSLLRIYRTLIRSRLEYGSVVLHTASSSTMNRLVSVHNQCLRIITGCIRSTPTAAMENECGEPPLHLRIYEQQLKFAVKVKASIDNPAKETLVDSWQNHYCKQAKKDKSLYSITHSFLEPIGNIEADPVQTEPPWLLKPAEYDIGLLKSVRKDQNPEIIYQVARDSMCQYDTHLHIYTDGSKTSDNRTGAGVHIPEFDHNQAIGLPGHCSVFAAELVGIMFAVNWIFSVISDLCKPVVIFTDSVSSIRALKNKESSSYSSLLQCILSRIDQLRRRFNYPIVISWVPAHCSIRGNETADNVAKLATSVTADGKLSSPSPSPSPGEKRLRSLTERYNGHVNSIYHNVRPSVASVRSLVDIHVLNTWQKEYDSNKAGTFYKTLEPRVGKTVKFGARTRRKDVVITRLRVGRCGLNHYLHKIGKASSPLCTHCKVDETVEHFIMHCTKYAIHKHISEHTGTHTYTLQHILTQQDLIDILYTKVSSIGRQI